MPDVDLPADVFRPLCAPRDRLIAEIADRQHGAIGHAQLLALGLTPRGIRHRVAAGTLHRRYRGAYAVGHPRLSGKGELMVAVLAYAPSGVLSHRSAGAQLGLSRAGRKIHVTASGHAGRRAAPGIVLHRVRSVHPADVTISDGIPMTTVARTLLDIAEYEGPDEAAHAAQEADRQHLLQVRAVEEVCRRSKGRHGVKPLRQVMLALTAPDDARTELERRFLRFCRNCGLPEPAPNALVGDYVVDALWPGAKLIVELDSWAFHRPRAAFEGDRKRDSKLLLEGYRVLRVTSRRLDNDGAELERTIRLLLGESTPARRRPG
jgi:predicted transcriptional regulator of viral defense system